MQPNQKQANNKDAKEQNVEMVKIFVRNDGDPFREGGLDSRMKKSKPTKQDIEEFIGEKLTDDEAEQYVSNVTMYVETLAEIDHQITSHSNDQHKAKE